MRNFHENKEFEKGIFMIISLLANLCNASKVQNIL